jgi:hypothetical protein
VGRSGADDGIVGTTRDGPWELVGVGVDAIVGKTKLETLDMDDGMTNGIVLTPLCRRCSGRIECPVLSIPVAKKTRAPGEGPTSKSKKRGREAKCLKNATRTSTRGTVMTINLVYHAILRFRS